MLIITHARNVCVFSYVQKRITVLTQKGCIFCSISFGARSDDVTVVLGMRQNLDSLLNSHIRMINDEYAVQYQ